MQPSEPGNYFLASTGRAENNYVTTTFLEIEVLKDASDVQSKRIQDLVVHSQSRVTQKSFTDIEPSVDPDKIRQVIKDLFK